MLRIESIELTQRSHAVQDDARVLHLDEPAGPFLDETVDALQDLKCLAAEPQHLPVEPQAPVPATLGKGARDE